MVEVRGTVPAYPMDENPQKSRSKLRRERRTLIGVRRRAETNPVQDNGRIDPNHKWKEEDEVTARNMHQRFERLFKLAKLANTNQ